MSGSTGFFWTKPAGSDKSAAKHNSDSTLQSATTPERGNTLPTYVPDRFAASVKASNNKKSIHLLPKDGTHLLGGFMLGNDPGARQEVLEKIAKLRSQYGATWDPVGSTGGSGCQITLAEDLLAVSQGNQGLVLSTEASTVFIRHTADHRKINGVWGPAANRFLFRTGGGLGYTREICNELSVRADVLGGINFLSLRAEPDDGFSAVPHSAAAYVGGRLSLSRPRVGGYIQIDEDVNGPLKGNVRGTIGIVCHLNRSTHHTKG